MLRWMSSATLQDDPSVESFFNAVETEALALLDSHSKSSSDVCSNFS